MNPDLGTVLLQVARQAIAEHLGEQVFKPDLADHPSEVTQALAEPAACFVSLHQLEDHELRGCIGCLEATQPLLECVAEHAVACAFNDPRFRPLRAEECERLELEVSVLSPNQAIPAQSQEVLFAQLTPGIHGLILAQGKRRATFLPQVWDSLPDKHAFLAALLRKGGWYGWPDADEQEEDGEMLAWRYTVEHVSAPLVESRLT